MGDINSHVDDPQDSYGVNFKDLLYRLNFQQHVDSNMVAHGRVVSSSRQITEVKQHRAPVSTWMGDRCSSHAAGHV